MRLHIALLGVLVLVATSPRLYADAITVSGSGGVRSLGGSDPEDVCVPCAMEVLGFSFAVGDSLAFSLSFQAPTGDHTWPNGLGSGMLTLAGAGGSFTKSIVASAQILNTAGPARPSTIADEILISAGSGGRSPGEDPAARIGIVLYGSDFVGTWLTTNSWPADVAAALNAAPFSAVWLFDSAAEHGLFAVLGDVRFTQTPAPVPEPSTVTLLGVGAAIVGVRRWRQRWNRSPRC